MILVLIFYLLYNRCGGKMCLYYLHSVSLSIVYSFACSVNLVNISHYCTTYFSKKKKINVFDR